MVTMRDNGEFDFTELSIKLRRHFGNILTTNNEWGKFGNITFLLPWFFTHRVLRVPYNSAHKSWHAYEHLECPQHGTSKWRRCHPVYCHYYSRFIVIRYHYYSLVTAAKRCLLFSISVSQYRQRSRSNIGILLRDVQSACEQSSTVLFE